MNAAYDIEELNRFARDLLAAAGIPAEKAVVVAEILLAADLLGHDTHGLALLPAYLKEIAEGRMEASGDYALLSKRPGCAVWDGRRLPGPWLVSEAIALAAERAPAIGTFTVVIRRSHHIGCLAAYLKPVTDRGLMVLIASSDPSVVSVAPFGGTARLYSPNPLAAGIPTSGDPILIDVSMSTTTIGMTSRARAEGKLLPHAWILDAGGNATRDPEAYFADPPGSILPLGGMESGHKGFALGLLIEALTSGLAGYGRADSPDGWGASVFVQVTDPEAFGGVAGLRREMDHLADSAHASPPAAGHSAVRLSGEAGLRRRREQLDGGVRLHAAIMPALTPWAERLSIDPPRTLEPKSLAAESYA